MRICTANEACQIEIRSILVLKLIEESAALEGPSLFNDRDQRMIERVANLREGAVVKSKLRAIELIKFYLTLVHRAQSQDLE